MGQLIRDVRLAIGWSQRQLGRRAKRSQSCISRAERGLIARLAASSVTAVLAAMGATLVLDVNAPHLADRRRQREPAHARLAGHVAPRLQAAGWRVATEVEIGTAGARGWIDVLAWHPETGLLLVIEVKTEIHDLGGMQRTLSWYEREASRAARERGWAPRQVHGSLLLLFTEANERRSLANRHALATGFPVRAAALAEVIDTGRAPTDAGRSVAFVDPRSRRARWVRLLRLDGRRGPAPYADYADYIGSRRSPRPARAGQVPRRAAACPMPHHERT